MFDVLQSWDEGLANLAKRWAENCVWAHDPGHLRWDYGTYDNFKQSFKILTYNSARQS